MRQPLPSTGNPKVRSLSPSTQESPRFRSRGAPTSRLKVTRVDPSDSNSSDSPGLSLAMLESITSTESVSGDTSCQRAPGQPSTISGLIPQGAKINVPLYKLSGSYRTGDSTISGSATEKYYVSPGATAGSPPIFEPGRISWDLHLTDWSVRFVTSPPDQVNPTVFKRLGYKIKSVHVDPLELTVEVDRDGKPWPHPPGRHGAGHFGRRRGDEGLAVRGHSTARLAVCQRR